MKNFVLELIANRFGIVLAAINICYFTSKNFVNYVFSHSERCLFDNYYLVQGMRFQYAEFMLALNFPSLVVSAIQGGLTHNLFPNWCSFTHAKFQIVFLIFFITMQWLLIGWTAKTIAQAVRPNQN